MPTSGHSSPASVEPGGPQQSQGLLLPLVYLTKVCHPEVPCAPLSLSLSLPWERENASFTPFPVNGLGSPFRCTTRGFKLSTHADVFWNISRLVPIHT